MEQTEYNFKWEWCWFCNAPSASFDFEGKNYNDCCANWPNNQALDEARKEWETANPRPTEPTPEMIQDWVNGRLELTEEEKLLYKIFPDNISEDRYFFVKKWADKIGFDLMSYEELCRQIGMEPVYDCETGEDWQKQSPDIQLLSFEAWPGDTFKTERIPWYEYCLRRRQCICDYSGYIERIKKRRPDVIIAAEAKAGDRIKLITGSLQGETATVIESIDGRNSLIKVRVDGKETDNLISINNLIEFVN